MVTLKTDKRFRIRSILKKIVEAQRQRHQQEFWTILWQRLFLWLGSYHISDLINSNYKQLGKNKYGNAISNNHRHKDRGVPS